MHQSIRLFPSAAPAEPLATIVTHIPVNGGCATAIVRTWEERKIPSCGGLCPVGACTFADGVCVVGVARHVPVSACAAFRRC